MIGTTTANFDTYLMTSTGNPCPIWCDLTTTATTSGDVWTVWRDDITGSTASITSTADTAWVTWAGDSTLVVRSGFSNEGALVSERTPEQQRTINERVKKDRQERQVRQIRAVRLLREVLDKKQLKDFNKHGHFFVRSPKNNIYRIRNGRAGNVALMSRAGIVRKRFCAHPQIHCPDEDTMLVQKIMLEHFEADFLHAANEMAA